MKSSVIKGFELQADLYRLNLDVIPEGFDISDLELHTVDYFKKYGYRISSLTSELYSRYNGIVSEKYINPSLYYYYIVPYLTKMDFLAAYDDKNIYSRLFPNMKQPVAVLKNMNGRFFIPDESSLSGESEISKKQAIDYLSTQKDCAIKPSMGSGGNGVQLMRCNQMNKREIEDLLSAFDTNYIVQEVVYNNEIIRLLNPTSLNTCRIYTYRRVDSEEYIHLGSAIRFGGDGSFRDNACSGGGFCRINEDGLLDDTIYRYNHFEKGSLSRDKGLKSFRIPMFNEMVECCKQLHRCLPYNDLIGWDITVDDSDELLLVEYNYAADSEFMQIFNGPMFGEYTEELLEKVSQPITEDVLAIRRSYANAPEKSYLIDMNKVGSL